jgi:hypothetical protein
MEEKEFDLQAELNRALNEDAPSVENEDVAEPQVEESVVETPQNTKTEQDSYYADMRRKQELDEARSKNAALQAQLDRAKKALNSYWDGENIDDLVDRAMAQADGVDVATVRQNRMAEANQQSLMAELEQYRQNEVNRQMENDLREIQSIDPTITSLNDLPPSFISLRFNEVSPMDAKSAFLRMRAIESQQKTPKPASTGSMTSTGKSTSEFFTSQELDNLTSKDLDDPKIMEKAMRSLERLK